MSKLSKYFLIAIVISLSSVTAAISGPKTIVATAWGMALPPNAEKVQIYREFVIFKLRTPAADVATQLIAAVGGQDKVKVYNSKIGATTVIFIEPRENAIWTSIQIAEENGKNLSYVVIARDKAAAGWKWKKSGDYWEYR